MKKVVPFERDAAYLAGRAAVNRRNGELLDALSLYRQAAKKAPEELQYQIDAAETLCEMGCCAQSVRALSAILARPDAPEDCFFGLCCNFFGMNELEASYRAMVHFLAISPESGKRPEVAGMLKNILLLRALKDRSGRRQARADRLYDEGRLAFERDEPAAAERLLRRALNTVPNAYAGALLALVLLSEGKKGAAGQCAIAVSKYRTLSPTDIESCVRVLAACGETARARALLDRLANRKPMNASERRHLIGGLCALRDDEALRPLLSQALCDTPFDPALLHICAVNRLRQRHLPEQAAGYWMRMLRIDPEDDVARYCLGLYEKKALPRDMSYEYALPEDERALRLRRLQEAQTLRGDALRAPEYTALCRFGIRSGCKMARVMAISLLPRLSNPGRRILAKEAAYAPSRMALPCGVHLRWPSVAQSMAAVAFCETAAPVRVPPMLRRAMRLSVITKNPEYGDLTASVIRMVVSRLARKTPMPRVTDAPCAAAGIVISVLEREKRAVDARAIARLFGCSERRARKSARNLFGAEEQTHETD